jgi:MoaA/NifB/PqqE/SkfB family radical SAM enzyme
VEDRIVSDPRTAPVIPLRRAAGQYGFYGRLTAAFPGQVIVDMTEVCNLACIHCPHPDFKRSARYGGRHLDPELNRKLVDEVREYGTGCTQYIRYTSNGEPLAHPHCYDMLEYAVQRSGVLVALTTNGTIMNERRMGSLLESGLHLIDVSIDAFTPETYARIRVNGKLDVTRANVLRLIEAVRAGGHRTRVVVSYVEQPENRHETRDFEQFWREAGAYEVVIRRLHSAAGAVPAVALAMHGADEPATRRPCLYPWERISLTPDGKLAFCPQDWVHGSVVADYHTTTIRDVWQSPYYTALREAHLSNDFSCHAFCGQCPDWQQTRWPGEGRSYADMMVELRDPACE